MQQIEWCKHMLKLPNFGTTKIKGYGYVGSAQLIMVTCLFSLILCAVFKTINPNYIIVGVLLPLVLAKKGVNIEHYWQCFAVLLLVRRFTNVLAFLDILLIICLWNPNIGLSKWIGAKLLPSHNTPTK